MGEEGAGGSDAGGAGITRRLGALDEEDVGAVHRAGGDRCGARGHEVGGVLRARAHDALGPAPGPRRVAQGEVERGDQRASLAESGHAVGEVAGEPIGGRGGSQVRARDALERRRLVAIGGETVRIDGAERQRGARARPEGSVTGEALPAAERRVAPGVQPLVIERGEPPLVGRQVGGGRIARGQRAELARAAQVDRHDRRRCAVEQRRLARAPRRPLARGAQCGAPGRVQGRPAGEQPVDKLVASSRLGCLGDHDAALLRREVGGTRRRPVEGCRRARRPSGRAPQGRGRVRRQRVSHPIQRREIDPRPQLLGPRRDLAVEPRLERDLHPARSDVGIRRPPAEPRRATPRRPSVGAPGRQRCAAARLVLRAGDPAKVDPGHRQVVEQQPARALAVAHPPPVERQVAPRVLRRPPAAGDVDGVEIERAPARATVRQPGCRRRQRRQRRPLRLPRRQPRVARRQPLRPREELVGPLASRPVRPPEAGQGAGEQRLARQVGRHRPALPARPLDVAPCVPIAHRQPRSRTRRVQASQRPAVVRVEPPVAEHRLVVADRPSRPAGPVERARQRQLETGVRRIAGQPDAQRLDLPVELDAPRARRRRVIGHRGRGAGRERQHHRDEEAARYFWRLL